LSENTSVPYSLVRFKRFFFNLLRNKKSAAGLTLLSIFVFIAVAGPLLTPYTPLGSVVSAQLNPPSWIVYFTGPLGWSQNAEFTGIKASSITGATLTTTSIGGDSASFSAASGASGGTVEVQKFVTWTYPGPAKRFVTSLSITPGPTILGQTVIATVYLDRFVGGVRDARWNIFDKTIDSNSTFEVNLDSISGDLRVRLGLSTSNIDPAQLIFSRQADYAYALELTLPPSANIDFSLQNFKLQIRGSTWGWLGTDQAGHDILTQLIYGARLSLIVGLLATFIGVGLGLVVGLIAGYLGRIVDEVLMRFTDMMLVIPGLPLLIVLVNVLGPSLTNIILVLGFLGWMGFARVVRSQVLSLRERPFIEAAKASGAGTGYITLRHILPNVVSLTYVNLALSVPAAIVGEAALSFLGLGDQTSVTWGRMLELARESGGSATNLFWWWVIPPGIGIALVSLSFILIGFSLDELFNPRLRRRR